MLSELWLAFDVNLVSAAVAPQSHQRSNVGIFGKTQLPQALSARAGSRCDAAITHDLVD